MDKLNQQRYETLHHANNAYPIHINFKDEFIQERVGRLASISIMPPTHLQNKPKYLLFTPL